MMTEIPFDELIQIQLPFDEWRSKRDTDIEWCMRITVIEQAENGKVRKISKPCGEPDCPRCGPEIRDKIAKALNKVLTNRPLRKITLTGTVEEQKEQRAKIIRRYGKNKVSAFVTDILTESGIELETEMLIDTEDEIGQEYVVLTANDLEKWSLKSFLSKKSGNLHKTHVAASNMEIEPPEMEPAITEKDDKAVTVTVEKWKTNCRDEAKIDDLENEVLQKTKRLNPKTLSELKAALITRRIARRKIYEENDVVILSNKSLKVKVRMSEVDWKCQQIE